MKPSGPGLLFIGNFMITASISLGEVCSDILILPDLVLEDYMILGIYPLPGCPVCWYIVHNIFLQSFDFFGVSCHFSFIYDDVYLGPFSFFLDESD